MSSLLAQLHASNRSNRIEELRSTDRFYVVPTLEGRYGNRSALIEDLFNRGLDRKVLVIVTGEFGRTPRIEHVNGRPGRDHYAYAMSILVSGGGMRMGQVVGSTNSLGEHPDDRLRQQLLDEGPHCQQPQLPGLQHEADVHRSA